MKTREEIESLKRDWVADPCWDIEDTEGFEAYREELIAFRERKEKEWARKKEYEQEREERKIAAYAESMGLKNMDLARHIFYLTNRIEVLEDRLEDLERMLNKKG